MSTQNKHTNTKQRRQPLRCGRLVLHQGRWVSGYWYNRYVVGVKPPKKTRREPILARFHMPANLWAPEPAETRLMNLRSKPALRWVMDISACYAATTGRTRRLTTFFPDLENTDSAK